MCSENEIFARTLPTEEEIELCRTCKNAYIKCCDCVPDDSCYEKE